MKYVINRLMALFFGAYIGNWSKPRFHHYKKIADEIMIHGKAYDNLRYLCKQIGPRLSGSANAQKSVLATAQMLKEAGADTVYLQPCMVPHWVRGEKETGFFELREETKYNLNICALGNSVGTGKKGVAGSVIEIKILTNWIASGRLV